MIIPAGSVTSLPSDQSIYWGFSLTNFAEFGGAKISGEIQATSPITVELIGASASSGTASSVLPVAIPPDTIYFLKNGTTDAVISASSVLLGNELGVGNYALLITNNGAAASTVTTVKNVVVSLPC